MIRYAALDSLVSLQLVIKIKELLETGIEAVSDKIAVGSYVDYVARSKVIARGVVIFIGGGGIQQRWGNVTIGKDKATIKLTEVFAQGHKLSIKHFIEEIQTFGNALNSNDQTVGVRTSSIRLCPSIRPSPFITEEDESPQLDVTQETTKPIAESDEYHVVPDESSPPNTLKLMAKHKNDSRDSQSMQDSSTLLADPVCETVDDYDIVDDDDDDDD